MKSEPSLFFYAIKAIFLKKNFGMQVACDYLRTRGITAEQAVSMLAIKGD